MAQVYNYNGDKGGQPIVTNGRIALAERDPVTGFRKTAFSSVTYFSQAQVALTTQVQQLFSSIRGARSLVDEFISEKGATINLTLQSAHAENLQIALFASQSKLVATSGTDETISVEVFTGGANRFGDRFALSVSAVKDTTGTTTYEEGKNYIVEYSTIYILSEAEQTAKGALELIEDGDVIKVTGKFMATTLLAGFVYDKVERELLFTGFNISKGMKRPLELWCPRASFQPSSFDLLSDAAFGTITVAATLLPDENIQGVDAAGNPLSQYFEYRLPQA